VWFKATWAKQEMITLEWLKEHEACSSFMSFWHERFGNKATVANTVRWLHKIGEKRWEMWLLTQTPEMTKAALGAGADIHAGGDRALVVAAQAGRLEVVELLLAVGVDVHVHSDMALIEAACYGHVEVVKLLLAAGAYIHAWGDAALKEAIIGRHAEVVEVLRAAGANFDTLCGHALRRAREDGYVETPEWAASNIIRTGPFFGWWN